MIAPASIHRLAPSRQLITASTPIKRQRMAVGTNSIMKGERRIVTLIESYPPRSPVPSMRENAGITKVENAKNVLATSSLPIAAATSANTRRLPCR